MKKFSLLFLVAVISMGFQSVWADTQTITSEIFTSENAATAAAQSIADDLKFHKYSVLTAKTVAQCKSISDLTVKGFRVIPVWQKNGESYKKGYQAEVNYDYSCEAKDRGPFWYANTKGI
jgi:uncharacterized protein YggE